MLSKHTYALRVLIHKISIRERIMLLATIFVLIVALSQGFLFISQMNNHEAIEKRISARQNESEQYKATLEGLKAALNNPRINALASSNAELAERIDKLNENIASINDQLMSPERMINLLRDLLEDQQNLDVVSFNVEPVTTIDSALDGGTLFYRHGLSITLEGEFEALVSYLEKIEGLPTQLFWGSLVVDTETFPVLQIKLDVHTLSQDEDWLNV